MANIFNKCHKEVVFMKNNWIWVYKIWAWERGWVFYALKGGLIFLHMQMGGCNLFSSDTAKFPPPLPRPVLISCSLKYEVLDLICGTYCTLWTFISLHGIFMDIRLHAIYIMNICGSFHWEVGGGGGFEGKMLTFHTSKYFMKYGSFLFLCV